MSKQQEQERKQNEWETNAYEWAEKRGTDFPEDIEDEEEKQLIEEMIAEIGPEPEPPYKLDDLVMFLEETLGLIRIPTRKLSFFVENY